jgi:predicted NBD/HSP70 family sugar kinase
VTTTTSPLSLRDRTVDDLFALLRQQPGMTRSDLVRSSGMSRSSVIYSVGRLIREGRIEEREPSSTSPGSGRPASLLFPVAAGLPVGGIDFGHRHIGVAVADALGQELASEVVEIDVDLDARLAVDRAEEVLRRLMGVLEVPELAVVVAGVPGPVDSSTGLVRSPTILSGWVGLNPAEVLTERLGVRVVVENDAVLGACGEHRRGAGQGHDHVLYVKASDGIGAALVLDGVSYRGARGLAGEIGHTRLENSAELCRCGNRGCLESVVSLSTVRQQLQLAHPGRDFATLDDLGDDPVTERIFNEAGRTMGRVFSDLCNLINPDLLVLGGTLGCAHPALVEGVRQSIDRFAQPATAEMVQVVAAGLGSRAELQGALVLASTRAPV